MPITAQNRESMLAAKCGNPEVIGRNRRSLPLKFQAKGGVRLSSLLVKVEHGHGGNPFLEPVLVARSMAGLRNAETVFAQDNYWHCDSFRFRNDRERRRISISGSRQSVRVQNQCQVSASICSESSSIIRLMRAVSRCRCFSLPMCFTQGFPAPLVEAASLSLTASVTNSRRGIPRSAATDLARRNTASGISKVVFIVEVSHIYGSRVNYRTQADVEG